MELPIRDLLRKSLGYRSLRSGTLGHFEEVLGMSWLSGPMTLIGVVGDFVCQTTAAKLMNAQDTARIVPMKIRNQFFRTSG